MNEDLRKILAEMPVRRKSAQAAIEFLTGLIDAALSMRIQFSRDLRRVRRQLRDCDEYLASIQTLRQEIIQEEKEINGQ